VTVPAGPHEVPDLQPGLLGDEVNEQGVAGDVEWDTEEQVGAALVELAGELTVGDIELEQRVTRRQSHLICSTSPAFHAETTIRRESGSRRRVSSTSWIWSTWPPPGLGHERHCTP